MPELVALLGMAEPDLRVVLERGDAPDRVRAAWALGLRRGDIGPVLAAHLGEEPSAGVRCHLAVVLAGLGEDAAVIALAEDDASPIVRATACVALLRVAARDARHIDRVLGRLESESSADVRRRVIESAPSGIDVRLTAALRGYASHPDRELRTAVLARFEAGHDVELGVVSERALAEPDRDLARRWARLWAARAPRRAVDRLPAGRLTELLRELLDDGGAIPIVLLAAAVSSDVALDNRFISTVVTRQGDHLPRGVLLGLLARYPGLADARWPALLRACQASPLEPAERASVHAITSFFRQLEKVDPREVDGLYAYGDSDDPWEEPPSEEEIAQRQAELDERRLFLDALEDLAGAER